MALAPRAPAPPALPAGPRSPGLQTSAPPPRLGWRPAVPRARPAAGLPPAPWLPRRRPVVTERGRRGTGVGTRQGGWEGKKRGWLQGIAAVPGSCPAGGECAPTCWAMSAWPCWTRAASSACCWASSASSAAEAPSRTRPLVTRALSASRTSRVRARGVRAMVWGRCRGGVGGVGLGVGWGGVGGWGAAAQSCRQVGWARQQQGSGGAHR